MIVNSPSDCQPSRMSVRTALFEESFRLLAEAERLENLARVVPEDERDWPAGAADALWDLLMRNRR